MSFNPVPPNEIDRLAALNATGLLDTEPEQRFDRITHLAASFCDAPIALVSLVDQERQWFKSKYGLDVCETPREHAFCAHAIMGEAPLLVYDAESDPRFEDNPLVTSEPFIRSYYGVPIHAPSGYPIGTLCVIYTNKAQSIGKFQLDILQDLARLIELEIRACKQTAQIAQAAKEIQRYKAAVELMSEGLVIHAQPGQVVQANEAASEILQLPLDELIGRPLTEENGTFFRPDGTIYAATELPTYRALHEGVATDGIVIGADLMSGDRRWLRVRCKPFQNEDRQGGRMAVTTFEDITEETKAHLRLRTAAKSAQFGVWELNVADGAFIADANLAATFELTADEPDGTPTPFLERIVPEDREGIIEALSASLTDLTKQQAQFRIQTRNGDIKHLRSWWINIGGDDHAAFIGCTRDETAQVEAAKELWDAKEEAVRANKAKSDFLATISHEIRTPMNGVLGMASALSRTNLTDRQKDMTSVIADSGQSLMALIDDLLDLSKAEAGRMELDNSEFKLKEVLENSHTLFLAKAEEKGLRFSVSVSALADDYYIGDAKRLRQVIDNLVSNAIKFTDDGAIEVRAGIRDTEMGLPEVVVNVSDTGIGIPHADQEYLFDEFRQVDCSKVRQVGGTGLGLAICRKLVELMGGWIELQSTEGKGSVFRFGVPLERISQAKNEPAVSLEAEVELEEAACLITGRILVAEDNDVNRRVLQALLSEHSIDIVFAHDGREAIELWNTQAFDLILMDMHMPEMDGITATKAIREAEAANGKAAIPIVALTANAMPQQIKECLEAGCDSHVAKPIEPTELVDALSEALLKSNSGEMVGEATKVVSFSSR